MERRADAVRETVLPLQIVDGVDGTRLGDDPRGRWHINFAARAQF